MKALFHLIAIVALVAGWGWFASVRANTGKMEQQLIELEDSGDTEAALKFKNEVDGRKSTAIFTGVLLSLVSAGYGGILLAVYALPALAHKFTHAVYDSGEVVKEDDAMHDARSLVAQGDYEGAILAFREAAQQEPENRLPWVEIAKIQRDNLEDPQGAVETLRECLANHPWKENDAAFLLFRLSEIYEGDLTDRESAAVILQQVIDQFPQTRHSANARTKLHEWGMA